MEKDAIIKLIEERRELTTKERTAIMLYMKEHPSVFTETIKYNEEYGDYRLVNENGEFVDWCYISNYIWIDVENYFEDYVPVRVFGMTEHNDNIVVWGLDDNDELQQCDFKDISKNDYNKLLEIIKDGKEYEID